MTVKEKAKDIYDKMKGFRVKNTHRKKCALACVDEITKHVSITEKDYWDEVEREIEDI